MTFYDGIGGNRGAVHDVTDVGVCQLGFLQNAFGCFQESARRIVGRRRDLADADFAGRFVDQCGVGKRPADVDAQSV